MIGLHSLGTLVPNSSTVIRRGKPPCHAGHHLSSEAEADGCSELVCDHSSVISQHKRCFLPCNGKSTEHFSVGADMESMSSERLNRRMPIRTQLTLADISGDHPLRAELVRCGSLLPMRPAPTHVLSPEGLLRIARQFPISVMAHERSFVCIGSFHLYSWLRQILPLRTQIPVDLYPRLNRRALEEHILTDLVIAPVLFGAAPGDIRPLCHNWQQLQQSGLFQQTFVVPAVTAFAKLRGTKTRRRKSHA